MPAAPGLLSLQAAGAAAAGDGGADEGVLVQVLGEALGDVLQAAGDGGEVGAVVHGGRPALRHQLLHRARHPLPEPARRAAQR